MSTTIERLSTEVLRKLHKLDFTKIAGYEKSDDVLSREVGEVGSDKRNDFDAKAHAWYQDQP